MGTLERRASAPPWTGSYLITIVARPALRERNCEARRTLRGRAARRSAGIIALRWSFLPPASCISEFLCARLSRCLIGAAALGPPALLRVRLLGRPHRGSGRPTLVAETAAAPDVQDLPVAASEAKTRVRPRFRRPSPNRSSRGATQD